MLKLTLAAALGAVAVYAAFALAQPRADLIASAAVPISSSSSNGTSWAWFYDAASRTVFACRAGQGAASLDCKDKAVLP